MTDPTKEEALRRARELRAMAGDTSPGIQLALDETWEWPLHLDASGKPTIDPAFFERVKKETGRDLTTQQVSGVLETWYKQALKPLGFVCPIMESILSQGRNN